jgi:outer membrane immunogenic protein
LQIAQASDAGGVFVKQIVLAGLTLLGLGSFAFAAPPAPASSWTGFYVGGNVGYGWGNRGVAYVGNDPNGGLSYFTSFGYSGAQPPATSFMSSGVIGGIQAGYNWQISASWLVGFETDFDWAGIKGSDAKNNPLGAFSVTYTQSVDEHVKWFGTVRGRIGYLPADSLLVFITGGFAYGRVEHSGNYLNDSTVILATPGVHCNGGATCFSGSASGVVGGWTVGGGIEYAIWQSVTLKAEYLYVSLESKSFNEQALLFNPAGQGPASIDVNYGRTNINVVRAGLNFRL